MIEITINSKQLSDLRLGRKVKIQTNKLVGSTVEIGDDVCAVFTGRNETSYLAAVVEVKQLYFRIKGE